ncbi:hypothetical protein PIB30_113532, partial [Stylosanthes scabra]|nr:hypothetical protein [Stylosanthes scabra]
EARTDKAVQNKNRAISRSFSNPSYGGLNKNGGCHLQQLDGTEETPAVEQQARQPPLPLFLIDGGGFWNSGWARQWCSEARGNAELDGGGTAPLSVVLSLSFFVLQRRQQDGDGGATRSRSGWTARQRRSLRRQRVLLPPPITSLSLSRWFLNPAAVAVQQPPSASAVTTLLSFNLCFSPPPFALCVWGVGEA